MSKYQEVKRAAINSKSSEYGDSSDSSDARGDITTTEDLFLNFEEDDRYYEYPSQEGVSSDVFLPTSSLEPSTREKGKPCKLMVTLDRQPLDIEITADIMKENRQVKQAIKHGFKDSIGTVNTNLLDFLCERMEGYNFKRNRKQAKRLKNCLREQVTQTQASRLQKFYECSKKNTHFQMLRELFGYPNNMENGVTETTEEDRLRILSHDYLTTNDFVAHINAGYGNFENKLKLIKLLDVVEGLPVRPEKCIGMSLSNPQS